MATIRGPSPLAQPIASGDVPPPPRDNPLVVVSVHDSASALRVVQRDGTQLRLVAEPARQQFGINLAAVQQNGNALQYVTGALRQRRELNFAAVQQNGLALRHVTGALRLDAEINATAVSQNGRALRYVVAEMRAVAAPLESVAEVAFALKK